MKTGTCSFSTEGLSEAFIALDLRCLSQSAAWVLEFLMESGTDCRASMPSLDAAYLLAQTQFRTGEFKRAVNTLSGRTDQYSIGLTILSKLLDVQRGLEQNVTSTNSFLGVLPVSTSSHFSYFEPLIDEFESQADSFDALNSYLFAAILSKGGRYQRVVSFLVKSLNEFPLNRSAWKLLLTTLLRLDDSEITKTLQLLPDHWCSLLFRVELLSELQKAEEAIQILSQLSVPRTTAVIALEAVAYYHNRQFNKAQELFEELRAADPLRVENMDLYSNLLFVNGDTARLSELMRSLTEINKFQPETLAVAGNYFALNWKYEEAISHLAMALRVDSSYGFAWTLIGHEFIILENLSAAISAYTKACEANPRDFRALYGLGRAYMLSKMPYHAIIHYRNAAAICPQDPRIWLALGESYEELMETENAVKCYQKSIAGNDSDGIASYRLARVYRDCGDDDRAAFCFEHYAEQFIIDEETARTEEAKESIIFLANYYKEKNNIEKAKAIAQKLLLDPLATDEMDSLMHIIMSDE